jgi:hypothetical protein
MLEPWHGERLGVTYISPVKFDFKDTPSTSNIGPTLAAITNRQIKLGLTVPQQVMLSGYQKINKRRALIGNLVWQNWSKFGEPELSVANTAVSNETANLNYDDTWGFALGAQYAIADGWLVVGRRRLRHLADVRERTFPGVANGPAVPARHRHPVQLQRQRHGRPRLPILQRRRQQSGSPARAPGWQDPG